MIEGVSVYGVISSFIIHYPLPPQAVVLRGVSSKTIDGAGSYPFSSPLSMLAEQSIDFLKLSVFVGVQSGAYKEDDLRQV